MPAAVAVPAIATAVAGGLQAATGVYGAKKKAQADREALQVEQENNLGTLAYMKQKDAQDHQDYVNQQALKKQQWDAWQAQRQPYVNASLGALAGYRPTPYTPAPSNPMSLGAMARRSA